jgi:hypothetical protein
MAYKNMLCSIINYYFNLINRLVVFVALGEVVYGCDNMSG